MPTGRVPADRLAVPIEQYLNEGGTVAALAQRSDLRPRHIWGIRNGDRRAVTLEVADKLLTAVESSWLWHLPASSGGFADVYEEANDA